MNLKKYDEAFIESLEISKEQINSNLVYQSVPTWDSVGHMGLIAELEDAFDIMMSTEDVIEFNSYEKGKEILRKYNIQIG